MIGALDVLGEAAMPRAISTKLADLTADERAGFIAEFIATTPLADLGASSS